MLTLLAPSETAAIQLAALTALQSYTDDAIAEALIARYAAFAPDLKSRARGLLVSRANWSQQLVDAVRQGKIEAKEVELEQVRQMLAHHQPHLEQQIEKLWGKVTPATTREKQGKINAVQIMLAKGRGDAVHGKLLMRKHCGTCHQLYGEGNKIGPDLTAADRDNLNVLVPSVVDPSAVIRPEFAAYTLATSDGRVLTGLLAESTADSVTLLDAKNVRTTINRADIEQLEPADASLMPERILDPLSEDEIRDLFEYLRSR